MTKPVKASSGLMCEPRFGTRRNPDRPTLGHRVAEAAVALGVPLQPWQRYVADVAMELDAESGRLVYREVNLALPRQGGKTTLALAMMVTRCTRFGQRQQVVYTAQSRKAAAAKFRDQHLPMLEGSPFAAYFDVRRANGSEGITWRNGSQYGLDAPTETSGHGLTLDLALVDEAWAFEDDRQEQSLAPTMITRPSAQLWVMSTAGNARSRYWYDKIQAGRKSVDRPDSTAAFFEWSAPDDADPEDPAVWAATIPSLGHTIDEVAVRAELERAQRGGTFDMFRRAYMNQWVEVPPDDVEVRTVLPLEWFDDCLDDTSRMSGERVFAVDLTPDRSTLAIVAAGPSSNVGTHIEVVDHVRDRGADWLVGRLTELSKRFPTRYITAHLAGPIGTMQPALQRAFGKKFLPVTDKELLGACATFHDAVRDGQIAHIGEPGIRAALEGAAKSHSGDQWRWSRRGSGVDISPLVAATIAWHAATLPADDPNIDAWLEWAGP